MLPDSETPVRSTYLSTKRLRDNAGNPTHWRTCCEGMVALMFLRHGWQVVLRERPDLQLGWHGDAIYAEVKRFCEKEQDRLNERVMAASAGDFLVPLEDDPVRREGKTAWEQIAEVAIRKSSVYVEDTPTF